MSATTRALCRIIEERPFITLTDHELFILYNLVRLADVPSESPGHGLVLRVQTEVEARENAAERSLSVLAQGEWSGPSDTRPRTEKGTLRDSLRRYGFGQDGKS